MSEQLALLPGYLTAHLQLSLLALLVGALVSIPLGVTISRRARLEGPVSGVASVLQTIPSLALLALMVPLLASLSGVASRLFGFEISSIGFLPAWIALSLYSVLPILRNTVTGISGVDPALIEAARGVGMTQRQQLHRVELPLALPVIVAGLRTATVWVVGTATLATPVGATSLGNYIFSGLQTRNFVAVAVGSVAAAVLAILLDALIRSLERGLVERSRPRVVAALTIFGALYLYVGGSLAASALGGAAGAASGTVSIGAKTFTEQYILADLLALEIESQTGRKTRQVGSLGSTVVFDALRSGEIDVYVEYSGTIWLTLFDRKGTKKDRASVLRDVEAELPRDFGVFVVGSLGFENTYELAMRRERAEALGVRTISELVPRAPELVLGADYEFLARPEWVDLKEQYGLDFRDARSMDSSLMYAAVAQGEVDVISAYSTDGRIAAFDLVLLEDDRDVIPPYDAIILVNAAFAKSAPEVVAALERLDGTIDATTMQRLNWAVDGEGRTPAQVARTFFTTRQAP